MTRLVDLELSGTERAMLEAAIQRWLLPHGLYEVALSDRCDNGAGTPNYSLALRFKSVEADELEAVRHKLWADNARIFAPERGVVEMLLWPFRAPQLRQMEFATMGTKS